MRHDKDRIAALERRVEELTRQLARLPVRRARMGVAPRTSPGSKLALVTSQAGASTYTGNGITGGSVGRCALLDEDMQKVSPDSIDEIEFKGLHFVAVPQLCVIALFSESAIGLGTTWDGAGGTTLAKVWGEIVAAPYELSKLPGFAGLKSLAMGDGQTDPKQMSWLGGECPDP